MSSDRDELPTPAVPPMDLERIDDPDLHSAIVDREPEDVDCPQCGGIMYGGDLLIFLVSAGAMASLGFGFERLEDGSELGLEEALTFVSLAWVGVSVTGTIPYLLAGVGTASTVGLALESPSALFVSLVNALFESTSGFTTTGATVLGEISFERHSRALLMIDS